MNDSFARAEAFAVKNGRIIAVGSTDEIQVYEFEFLNEIISSTKTYHFEFNPTGNTLNSNLAIKAIIVEYQNE